MKYFDKTFFKFLIVFLALISLSIGTVIYVRAQAATLVNINTAGLEELKTLNGIGDVKGQAIIDYRAQNGAFQKIEDIKNVSGIGDVTYANIKDFITVGETTTPPGETTNTQTQNSSGQSLYTTTSDTKISPKAELSAGKDRTGTAGSPVEFAVETNLVSEKSGNFIWNFGDGSEGAGRVVSHAYNYPGEYAVVLTVTNRAGLTSRANVKIVRPEVSVTFSAKDRIEVANSSKSEINLFGRALVSGNKIFQFQKNTIIKPEQKISFASSLTGLDGSLGAALILLDTNMSTDKIFTKIEQDKKQEIERLHNELSSLQTELTKMNNTGNNIANPQDLNEQSTSQTASVAEAAESIETSVVKRWWSAIKKFFLRTK